MKRIITGIMISVILLVFTACGQNETRLFPGSEQRTEQENKKNPSAGSQNLEKSFASDDSLNNHKESADETWDTDVKNRLKTGIIAKSDNIIASKDKAAILKELDNELDELITSINELDDLEDSDLE